MPVELAPDSATLHVVRVFCNRDGSGGNPLGVFIDGHEVPGSERQAVARDLGFAETVFVDDAARGELRIFTPEVELPLAGHPLIGAAWLLRERGVALGILRPPAGEVGVAYAGEMTSITANPGWGPPFEFLPLDSPEEVDALDGPPDGYGLVVVWAWVDEAAGIVRDRVFLPEAGIEEDEATGSAALRLAGIVGRPIRIRQGEGSRLEARPIGDRLAEVAGRVVLDSIRTYPPAAAGAS